MKETIRIGRHKSNDLVFDFPQVSGSHAVLTPIGSNSLIVEDLGSSNGTYVNRVQVKRMIISQDDRLKVANILVDTKPYFVPNNNSQNKVSERKKQPVGAGENVSGETIAIEFKRLEEVWNTYQKVKINHKKKGFWKNMGFTVAGMGLGALLIPVTGGMSVMAGSMLGRGAAGLLKDDEKLQVVINEFKIHYCCPKCNIYLNETPYEGLVKRNSCLRCKTKWI